MCFKFCAKERSGQAMFNLGNLYDHQGDFTKAQTFWEDAAQTAKHLSYNILAMTMPTSISRRVYRMSLQKSFFFSRNMIVSIVLRVILHKTPFRHIQPESLRYLSDNATVKKRCRISTQWIFQTRSDVQVCGAMARHNATKWVSAHNEMWDSRWKATLAQPAIWKRTHGWILPSR